MSVCFQSLERIAVLFQILEPFEVWSISSTLSFWITNQRKVDLVSLIFWVFTIQNDRVEDKQNHDTFQTS